MKRRSHLLLAAAVMLTALPAWGQSSDSKIKYLVPNDAHLAVYAKENPERDYQKQYMADVWQTVQDERLLERIMEVVSSNVPEDKLAEAQSLFEEVKTAAAPIDCTELTKADEFVYAQVLDVPFNHHVAAVKLTEEIAGEYLKGVTQLMKLLEEKSGGEVPVNETTVGEAKIVELLLPFDDSMPQKPFQPCAAQVGDLFVMSSKSELLRQAIRQLEEGGDSKFDDERLTKALASLPEAEDAIVFFDGEQLFEKLHGLSDFVKMASDNDDKATRAADIINAVINECEIIDYSVSVEYTDGNQNLTATLGKLADDAEGKLLFQAVAQGEPFEDWQSWAPADADAYSLSTGVNLHVLYEGVLEFVRREVPESHEALDKWEQIQQDVGVNLDRDILQSFSGECVSITLPAKAPDGSDTQHSVTALKCANPDKVRELLHRGFEGLQTIPAVQAQQLQLVPCEGLEGFEQLQAASLAMLGVTPVVGFHDGWMMFSSSQEAAERVIAVRKGEAASISGAESLQQFDLDVSGTVYAVKYTNIAAGIYQAAQTVEWFGDFLPMAIGMAGANADAEELKPVQEIVALLPNVANVIRKFDFMQRSLKVTKEGPEPMTYVTDGSMIIRAPEIR